MSCLASWYQTSTLDVSPQAACAEATTIGIAVLLARSSHQNGSRCRTSAVDCSISNDTSAMIGASHQGTSFRRSILGASDLSGILGCFNRASQSRRLFDMFGGLVRLVVGLRQLWLRFLKPFFDCRLPRHFGSSVALHGYQPRSRELVAALASAPNRLRANRSRLMFEPGKVPASGHLSIDPKRTCRAGAAVTLNQANPRLACWQDGE
jgi:hypothetical protein